MSYNVAFISLGCAKNQVNCEQMMATCQKAGYTIQAAAEGADVVVVNTAAFCPPPVRRPSTIFWRWRS